VLVPLLLFTNWLGHRWLFERAALTGSDILISVTKSRPAQYCRLITIDEREFEAYLGEWIQPEKLTTVLNAIMAYEPKVLAVDIDTSAPRFAGMKVPEGNSKIVWARVSHPEEKYEPGARKRSYAWKAGAVLGNRPDQPEYVGSPLLPQDPDWTVRGFQRLVPTNARTESLHWAILRAYCDSGAQGACEVIRNNTPNQASDKHDQAEEARVREFRSDWDFLAAPLSDVMNEGGTAKPRPGELGDIVLLGAKFSDVHPTPFGPRLGIELVGSAVESELAGDSDVRVHEWSRWALKVLLALIIAWLNSRLMPRWATLGTLLLLFVVFFASFLGIYYSIFKMDFLPFMIGIWIEQLIEGSEHAQHATH